MFNKGSITAVQTCRASVSLHLNLHNIISVCWTADLTGDCSEKCHLRTSYQILHWHVSLVQGAVQVIHTSIGSRFEAMVAVTMKLLMVIFDQSHSRAQGRDHRGASVGNPSMEYDTDQQTFFFCNLTCCSSCGLNCIVNKASNGRVLPVNGIFSVHIYLENSQPLFTERTCMLRWGCLQEGTGRCVSA